jgi:hypothetical protein
MRTEAKTLLPLSIFTNWLAFGERGVSSETIVGHLTGKQFGRLAPSYPYDPSDLRRCERLLREVPLARLAFPGMASCSPVWARLVAEWDTLIATMEEEVPGCMDGHVRGSAPRTYALMKTIIRGGEDKQQ